MICIIRTRNFDFLLNYLFKKTGYAKNPNKQTNKQTNKKQKNKQTSKIKKNIGLYVVSLFSFMV